MKGVPGQATPVDASTSVLDTTRVILVAVAVVLVVLAVVVLLWPGRAVGAVAVSAEVASSAGAATRKLHQRVEHGVAPAARSSAAGCGPVVTATMCASARDAARHVVGRVAHVDRRALVEQRLALGVGVTPAEHRVDVEARLVEAAARVGLVLRGDDDGPSAERRAPRRPPRGAPGRRWVPGTPWTT